MIYINQKLLIVKSLLFIVVGLCAFSSTAEALTTKKVDQQADEFTWQFSMGISALYDPTILKDDIDPKKIENLIYIPLSLDIYYKGIFIQSTQRRVGDVSTNSAIGYQLFNHNDWTIDLLYRSYLIGYDSSDIIDSTKQKDSILQGLDTRNDGDGLGLRFTKQDQKNILTIDVSSLITVHAGNDWVAEVFYSRLVPYKNWDIYLSSGLTYYTKDTLDYYTGIDSHEVTAERFQYQAKSGYKAQLEIFAQRPITKKWTLNLGVNVSYYPSHIKHSPIVDENATTLVNMGFMYAF